MSNNAAAVVGVALMVSLAACGGKNPGSPSGGGNSGSPGPSGATVTITAAEGNPKSVTNSSGQSVTFVNNDTVSHEIASNPHPAHTDCPAINALGILNPGDMKLTNALTVVRSCGYHDHLRDTVTSL